MQCILRGFTFSYRKKPTRIQCICNLVLLIIFETYVRDISICESTKIFSIFIVFRCHSYIIGIDIYMITAYDILHHLNMTVNFYFENIDYSVDQLSTFLIGI